MAQSDRTDYISATCCCIGLLVLSGMLILAAHHHIYSTTTIDDEIFDPTKSQELTLKPKMAIVGGLGSLREKDDAVTAVVDQIKEDLEAKTNTKYESIEVLNYKHQTVAGSNYFVKARVKPVGQEPKIAHLRIYKNIQQNVELTAFELDKELDEEIKYFQ